jgi:transcriptional regulator with XRE-family HTH domain
VTSFVGVAGEVPGDVQRGGVPQDPEEVARRIGQRIAELRRGAGLTQAKLAERLGVSVERVSRIEREGNLTVHTIVLVANALGVPAVTLWAEPAPAAPKGTRQGRPRKART